MPYYESRKRVCEWQPDWSQAPKDATAWEILAQDYARWHTSRPGVFVEAPTFNRPFDGDQGIYFR